MRKLVIAGISAGMLGALAFSAVAVAATFAPTPPLRVRAGVRPPHLLHAPYSFTVHGTIVPPKLLCPTGVTNPKYCEAAPADICSGQVAVTVSLGADRNLKDSGGITNRFKATVSGSCFYAKRFTIPAKDLTAKAHLMSHVHGRFVGVYTRVRYLGNSFMTPKSANPQITIAKLTNVS